MSRKVGVALLLVGLTAFLFVGCQRKAIIEGEAEKVGTPGVAEGEAAREQEEIEASLQTKQYPGIEGEILESSMLKDVHFAFDRYDLSPEAREILAQNAEFMLKLPEATFQIEGHCDERGTSEYNLALGERRAMSAKRYLISLGVPSSGLSTISYGEELPLDPRSNEEAWAKNRRAHSVILSR